MTARIIPFPKTAGPVARDPLPEEVAARMRAYYRIICDVREEDFLLDLEEFSHDTSPRSFPGRS